MKRSGFKKRATAFKLNISDIIHGTYHKSEEGSFLDTRYGLKILRAHIMATVIEKFESNNEATPSNESRKDYATLTVDDGTGVIRIKTWQEDTNLIKSISIGDIVDIVGRIREYEEELYLMPEAINKVADPNWELLRELEIIEAKREHLPARPASSKSEIAEEDKKDSYLVGELETKEETDAEIESKVALQGTLFEMIEQYKEDGVAAKDLFQELSEFSKNDIKAALISLIKEGAIYEPRPGYYRRT
ncbi:MAG: OB-fold nucleic acid binding domain-containing protein [Candidatus Hodarchaeota archaeon]